MRALRERLAEQAELGPHPEIAQPARVEIRMSDDVVLVEVEVFVRQRSADLPAIRDAVPQAGAQPVPVEAELVAQSCGQVDQPVPVVVVEAERKASTRQCVAAQQREKPRFTRDGWTIGLLAGHRPSDGYEAQQHRQEQAFDSSHSSHLLRPLSPKRQRPAGGLCKFYSLLPTIYLKGAIR